MHTRSSAAGLGSLAGWLALLALAGCGSSSYEQRLSDTLDSRRQGEIAAAREQLGIDDEGADPRAAAPSRPTRELEGEEWGIDFLQLRQLGSAVPIEGYVIRPPQGFEPIRSASAPPGVQMEIRTWQGPNRDNGTEAFFDLKLMLHSVDPSAPKPNMSERMRTSLAEISGRFNNFQSSPIEVGHVGDTQFVRCRFNGTEPNSGLKLHGFVYAGVDDRAIYTISGMDVEPHHATSLPIMEAAAMTFGRK